MSAFGLIEAEKARHSVPLLCRGIVDVSRPGYYVWRNSPHPRESLSFDAVLSEKIQTIHRNSRATSYGSPKVHPELRTIGIRRCSRKRVARLMRRAKLRGSLGGRRVRITHRISLQQAAPRTWSAETSLQQSRIGCGLRT